MHEVIDDIFMCATEFMHKSGLPMDEDYVRRHLNPYLWYSAGGSKNWDLWGCPLASCSQQVVLTPSKLPRCGLISFFRLMETIIRGDMLVLISKGASQLQPLVDLGRITVPGAIPRSWDPV